MSDEKQLADLHNLLVAALSHENATRNAAEQAINHHLAHSRDAFVFCLLQLSRTAPEPHSRGLCCIILRRKLPHGVPSLFESLSKELQNTIQTELLVGMRQEQSVFVRGQLCDLIADLSNSVNYPSLLPFLFECCESSDVPTSLVASCLKIFAKISEESMKELDVHLARLHKVYGQSFAHGDAEVRAAACWSCVVTMTTLQPSHYQHFQPFVPRVLETIALLLHLSNEKGDADAGNTAQYILQEMTELCAMASKLFRPFLVDTAKALAAIANNECCDDGARRLCLECLILLSEGSPSVVRKCGDFMRIAVDLSFAMMVRVEDDSAWHLTHESELIENSNFGCGEMAIDRLGNSIGPEKFTELIFPIVAAHIKNPDWKHCHAGLMAFGQVVEYFELDTIPIPDLLSFINRPDVHPRVRYAAIECIGQIANDFAPDYQSVYHHLVLPELCGASLFDSSLPRVQRHTVNALLAFVDGCGKSYDDEFKDVFDNYEDDDEDDVTCDFLEGYGPKLLESLYTLGTDNKVHIMVKEQVISTLASVALTTPKAFEPKRRVIMDFFKNIITSATDKQYQTLRGRAMEAISYVISNASDLTVHRQDALDLMMMYANSIKNGVVSDDTTSQYMIQTWPRMSKVLKGDFVQFLPVVVPSLLRALIQKGDLDTYELSDDLNEDELHAVSQGLTSMLEEKTTALETLANFATTMGQAFIPWLEETVQASLPLLKFYLNDDVRSSAMAAMPSFIGCAIKGAQKGAIPVEHTRQMFITVSQALIACMRTEPDIELLMTIAAGLQECITKLEGASIVCLDENGMTQVSHALLQVLAKSEERMREREAQRQKNSLGGEFDEDEEAELAGQNQAEDELNVAITDCLGSLVKIYKEAFIPTLHSLIPVLIQLMDKKSLPSSQKLAIFIWDDIAETLKLGVGELYQTFLPALLHHLSSTTPSVVQASAYGIAVCAQFGQHYFQPFVEASLRSLEGALQKGGNNPRFHCARDNVVSAIGKIAVYQNCQSIAIPIWLQHLPILVDDEEAENNCNLLFSLLDNGCITTRANMGHVARVFQTVAGGTLQAEVGKETQLQITKRLTALQ